MRFTPCTRSLSEESLDAVVVPVAGDGSIPAAALAALGTSDEPGGTALSAAAARLRIGAPGTQAWIVAADATRPDILLLGTGHAIPHARAAAMIAGNTVERPRVASLLQTLSPDATALTESWALGAYRFSGRALTPSHACEEVLMWGCDADAVRAGAVIGAATNTARDLVNTPPSELTPARFAERCQELGEAQGFSVRVVANDGLAELELNGLRAVGAASANPPVMIELRRGDPERPHLALVGKGITFDAGGLSLKSTDEMRTMKADMSGAAAVIGALIAAAELAPDLPVRAYLACAENMPGGRALRVGDVITHRNGLRTEVLDTDCEGRVVLSDLLSYAADARPTQIIDIATLSSNTGLGPEMWAVLGTDRTAVSALLAAGAASGEPGWELPLWEGYAPRLRSDVADLKNYDSSTAAGLGAIYAALYLKRFVADVPWAHVDLGLTVMRARATPEWRAGANGNGTRTLARYLMACAQDDPASSWTDPRTPRDLVGRDEPRL